MTYVYLSAMEKDFIKERYGITARNQAGISESWFLDPLFQKCYRNLGFDKIKRNYPFPDYFGFRNEKWRGIELELLSSSFFSHKHNLSKVDYVVCLEKTKEIPNVEVIELPQALMK